MNTATEHDHSCPICASSEIMELVEIPQVPVFCNVIWESKEDALAVSRGDITLNFCANCGHIFNGSFNPQLMSYTQAYENSLHFSPRFQAYANQLANRLVYQYKLQHKKIIEIGSGRGDFLKILCELGDNRGVGFDPSYGPSIDKDLDIPIQFVPNYYSEKYAHYPADIIVSRHVLEHIDQPDKMISSIRQVVGEHYHMVVFFEVPNALFTLQELGIWDIIYEHYSYFTPNSLSALFRKNGFRILKLSDEFNGQFLTIEAVPDSKKQASSPPLPILGDDLVHDAAIFKINYRDKVNAWDQHLKSFLQDGKQTIVWGAGSKGVTFLNILRSSHNIDYIVDLNPRKQGKFVSGSGQKIVPPDFLMTYKPDIVIIMNVNYEGEIKRSLDKLGVSAEILLA